MRAGTEDGMTGPGLAGGGVATLAAMANSPEPALLDAESAEEVNARLAAIVQASDDAIVSKTLRGTITSWNRGAERLYGWSAQEIVGKPLGMLVPEERSGEEWQILDAIFAGKSVDHYETQRLRKDGSVIDVSLTVSPIRDNEGKIVAAASIARDITERKRLDKELRESQRRAEAAKEEAERANRAKNEFLSRMSHELRTPLNVVLGFAQLLEMNDLNETDRQSVAHISKAGKHLLDLINEVLDIAKIEAGGMSLSVEPVRAGTAVHEVLDLMAPLAVQRNVTIVDEVVGDCWVLADLQRFKQVLLNLVSNAIKYNRDGGSVCVRAERSDANVIRIEVADTGTGIPEDRLADLFTPFQRLGAEQTQVEGAGLGLALSKGLVEAMGGRLGAESRPGQGSTFWMELEAAEGNGYQEHESGVWTAPGIPDTATRPTVLYIEDNLANVQLLEQVFARRPELQLLPAMQGGLGLELAREHEPALILLDLDLPDLNGREVLAQLRRDAATAHIPVVILTADATFERKDDLLEAGADDYLTKPIDVKRFMQVLDRYLLDEPAG